MNQPDQQQLLQQQAAQQEQMRQQNARPITLSLTVGEVNSLLQILNTGPLNVALPLVSTITQQAQEQLRQYQAAQQQLQVAPVGPNQSPM